MSFNQFVTQLTAEPCTDEGQQALDAIDVWDDTGKEFARKMGEFCSKINQLPSFVKLEKPEAEYLGSTLFSDWHSSDKVIAWKLCKPSKKRYSTKAMQSAREFLWRDIFIWRKLSHKNIIPFYGVTTIDFSNLVFAYPYAKNDNIIKYLKKNEGASRLELLHQVTEGLQYLHNLDIPHGALRTSNVLINDHGCVWLADYGLFPYRYKRLIENGAEDDMIDPCSAPEVGGKLNPKGIKPKHFKPNDIKPEDIKPVDIFAFSVLVMEVLGDADSFKQHLYKEGRLAPERFVRSYICEGIRPPRPGNVDLSEAIWKLVQSCWKQEPKERPKIGEVVRKWEEAMMTNKGEGQLETV